MSCPLVSIILPAYNVEKYIACCLDSILQQSYNNIEIIIVNDGSTDHTLEVAQQYQKRHTIITLIDQQNSGVSASRNTALKCAKGDYVLFVDADDWLDINTVQVCIEQIEAEHADVCFFAYQSEFLNRTEVRCLYPKSKVFNIKECENLQRRIIGPLDEEMQIPQRLDSYGTIWAKLYRREILQGIFFEDLKKIGTAEDSLFNAFVFKNVKRAVYINEPFYHYRKTENSSITSKFKPDLLKQWQTLFQSMNNAVTSEQSKVALQNRIAISLFGIGVNVCNSTLSFKEKNAYIKECLNSECYTVALKKLTLSYFPIYWKVFYFFGKKRISLGVLFLSLIIKMIRFRKV